MTLEEARAVWLLKVGSDWVDEVYIEDDESLWDAYVKLRLTDSLDKDRPFCKVKIKCRS